MGAIWELQNKFSIWKEIEVLACEAQAELGQAGITKEEAQWIRDHADFTVERIDEIEKVTNHDVIAFTTCMAEYIDADVPEGQEKPSRWVHYGMTSSDLGDTALSYQIVQAIDIILDDVKQLGETCKRRAFEFQNTLCVGRTHGIHAEPMTFGMKFGSWAWALKRAQTRLEQAREVAATGAISGAVGTYSSIDPYVEKYVCEKLGLTPDPLSTQVLARDRHAGVNDVHAVLGGDVGDGPAAAGVDLAQFAGLELYAGVVHDLADARHVLGAGVVAARLAASARVLVENQAVAQVCAVLRLEHAGVGGVEACGDVGGEHGGCGQRAAQRQHAALAGKFHDLGDGVLEELRGHARGAHAADLLLVHEHAHGGAVELLAGDG